MAREVRLRWTLISVDLRLPRGRHFRSPLQSLERGAGRLGLLERQHLSMSVSAVPRLLLWVWRNYISGNFLLLLVQPITPQ